MGDLVPLTPDSPWFRPALDAGDWDPCGACLYRGACREVRECHDDPPPPFRLRTVEPPDIVA